MIDFELEASRILVYIQIARNADEDPVPLIAARLETLYAKARNEEVSEQAKRLKP